MVVVYFYQFSGMHPNVLSMNPIIYTYQIYVTKLIN